ncbi:DUF421 domain-containing protein [Pelomonas sp. CA6]|uniref:DUF421 domain-containing protein n=1 Tax=Pelomonas sp. CA6 TaxID=2907999 RepID=UPI001F4C0509|nr:YetF domain-containing protein [Pelomonas sp. CA6]MCH7344739.1 DUF421 domain-containing protein [Pelomonas sp. CA6]
MPPTPDWGSLFELTVHPLELMLRGSTVYWVLFLMFRFVLRRDAGSIGLADVLLLVLIADAAQNAMAGEYRSISDGIVLVLTIAGWNWLIDWAGYRSERLRRFLQAPAILLVRDGVPLPRNLRREMITQDELMSALHQQGLERLDQVRRAQLESDGSISVVPRKEDK